MRGVYHAACRIGVARKSSAPDRRSAAPIRHGGIFLVEC